jgi:hypothetical protein
LERLERRVALDASGSVATGSEPAAIVGPLEFAQEETAGVRVNDAELPEFLQPQVDRIAFAQALTAGGAVMYGAWWCPHCAAQKALFGPGAAFLPYVEVSNPDGTRNQIAIEKNITSYPTWEFADLSRVIGEMTFEQLSAKTGIAIPMIESEELFAGLFALLKADYGEAVSAGHAADLDESSFLDLYDFSELRSIGHEFGLIGGSAAVHASAANDQALASSAMSERNRIAEVALALASESLSFDRGDVIEARLGWEVDPL